MPVTYLDRIVEAHRSSARDDTRSLDRLIAQVDDNEAPRRFAAALRSAAGTGVIAEIKRRSPSKGDISTELDPAELARAYERGGATCLSVLTDSEWFGGSPGDLRAARAAVGIPVLRKDFTVDARDVVDARLMGADSVLLIAAVLDDEELQDFHDLALELGLDALVEVHDELELERALMAGAVLIGVNQRDLVTFDVDQVRAVRMAPAMPQGVLRVAESGIWGPQDARALFSAGYDALLVGESLVRSGDPAEAVRKLRVAGPAAR